MQARETNNGHLIRLSRGERVIETLTRFCTEREIGSGTLAGVGAVMASELGYYDYEKREYSFSMLPEAREVASLSGNVALVDGAPFLHVHAILSACDATLACAGGHLREAVVAVTLEVRLLPDAEPIARAYDEATGLKLLDL